MMTQEHPPENVRPEYKAKPGESQEDALRCELLILIDYALEVGMTDDQVDEVFRQVIEERAKDRRRGFKIVDGGD